MNLGNTLVRLHASSLVTQTPAPEVLIPGTLTFGVNDVTQLPSANVAWSQRVTFVGTATTAALTPNNGTFSNLVNNIPQSRLLSATGAVTLAGTVIVTIPSGFGPTITVPVNVALGDSSPTVEFKIWTALNLNATFLQNFMALMIGTSCYVGFKQSLPNDTTFTVNCVLGTATGITFTSAGTNSQQGSVISNSNSTDCFGSALISNSTPQYLMLKCTGTPGQYITVASAVLGTNFKLYAGASLHLVNPPAGLASDTINFTAGSAGVILDVLAFSQG